MSTLPHIVSRVNGMKIPLLPGQASILHRFEQDQNRLVVASTSFNPMVDHRDDARDIEIPATRDPSDTADPRAHSNISAAPVALEKSRENAAAAADFLEQSRAAEQRAQAAEQELAELRAQLAAAQATTRPPARAKKVEAPVIEGQVL
jgi:hypothetical protein